MFPLYIVLTNLFILACRIGAFLLPAWWAYNVTKRGDSFTYALITFFGNALLLSALVWLLSVLFGLITKHWLERIK